MFLDRDYMLNKKTKLQRTLIVLLGFSCLFASGCRNIYQSNYIEDSPIGIVGQSTTQLLTDKEIIDFYKSHFPNGKPELSYEFKSKRSETKFFLNPRGSFKNTLEYEIIGGVERRY